MHVLQKNKSILNRRLLIFIRVTQIITDLKYLLGYSAQSKNLYPFYSLV